MSAPFKSKVTDFGGDGDTIVLLHGFLASSKYWKKLQPLLSSAGYRVITIDLLGFGNAPKPKHSDYSYDEHVTYLHLQIQNCLIRPPFIIIGHSMGALLAVRYARLFPMNVANLVLLHPPLYQDSAEAFNTLRNTNMAYRFLLDSRFRRIGWILLKVVAGIHIGPHGRYAREKSLKNIIEKAEMFDDLHTVSTSTLLLIGQKDRSEYIANIANHTLRNSVVVKEIPTAHHSPITETQLVKQLIVTFLIQQERKIEVRGI